MIATKVIVVAVSILSLLITSEVFAAQKKSNYVPETYAQLYKQVQRYRVMNLSKKSKCVSSSTLYFNQSFVNELVQELRDVRNENFSTLVSARRLEATAYLLQASLFLEGDIVETGTSTCYLFANILNMPTFEWHCL